MISALALLSLQPIFCRLAHAEAPVAAAAVVDAPAVADEGGKAEEKRESAATEAAENADKHLDIDPIGLVQLWGTVYDMDVNPQADTTGYGDPEDDTGVKVKRARLGVRAKWGDIDAALVGGAGAKYDAFSEDETNFSLYQASLGWGSVVGACRVKVDAGVIEMPFQADAMISSGELTFEERGMAAEHIADDRGTGISGAVGSKGGGIKGTLGVYNSGFNPFGDDNLGKSFVFRVDGKVGKRDTTVLWDPASERHGAGVGLGAAGLYTIDVSTTTMGAAADVVVRDQGLSLFGEGTVAQIKPTATTVTAPEVTDPTMRMGVTGEVNYAIGRWQPAARVSYYSDSALGNWTQVLMGLNMHIGMKNDPDIVRIGAGYVLRIESDPVPNDTVRIWAQAKI